MKKLTGLAVALAVMAYQPLASATTTNYSFTDTSHNNAFAEADGESYLNVAVTDTDATHIAFTFTDATLLSSFITNIVFDTNSQLTFSSFGAFSSGVDFSVDFSPSFSPAIVNFTAGFEADAKSPSPTWGVGAGESLTINFTYAGGADYNSVIAAFGNGNAAIAMHVQGYDVQGHDYSEKFVTSVPEPETYAMFLAGLGLMGFMARRRSKTS